MPSLILDDIMGDTKIELQLSHKASVDDKNADMINKVFSDIVSLKKKNKKLQEVMDDIELHPDYEKTITSTIEVAQKEDHEEIIENYFADMKLRETTWKEWEYATEKIGQENSDLHNEIKSLKKEIMDIKRQNELLKLKDEKEIKKLKQQVGVLQRKNKRLRKKVDEQEKEIKSATEVSVVYMKRYEQKVKEEKQIDEICSRIKVAPENNIDHLIGKIPS